MPDSVLMPAPVRTVTAVAPATHSATRSTSPMAATVRPAHESGGVGVAGGRRPAKIA